MPPCLRPNQTSASLEKFWTLKLVVESGSLKQAATVSKVSISAVSQSLTGLEKTLGRKLILRKDRKLLPTQYCREILSSFEPALQTDLRAQQYSTRSI